MCGKQPSIVEKVPIFLMPEWSPSASSLVCLSASRCAIGASLSSTFLCWLNGTLEDKGQRAERPLTGKDHAPVWFVYSKIAVYLPFLPASCSVSFHLSHVIPRGTGMLFHNTINRFEWHLLLFISRTDFFPPKYVSQMLSCGFILKDCISVSIGGAVNDSYCLYCW